MNQPPFDVERVFVIFGVVAAVYFATALYLWLSKDHLAKRRLLLFAAFAVSVGFLGLFVLMGFPTGSLLGFAAMIGVAAFLQVRAIQFCAACGATVTNQLLWSRAQYCPKCGASLTQARVQ